MLILTIKSIFNRLFGRKPADAQTLAQHVCGPQATATGRTSATHTPVVQTPKPGDSEGRLNKTDPNVHKLPPRQRDKEPHSAQCVGMMREFAAPCTCGVDIERRKKMRITSPSASVHRLPIPSMSSVLAAQAAAAAEEERKRRQRNDDIIADMATLSSLLASTAIDNAKADSSTPAPSYSGGGGSFDGGGASSDWSSSSSSSSSDSGSSSFSSDSGSSSCGSD